jgi:hypothetical protein
VLGTNYKIITSRVVLYGSEPSSVALREEHGLKMFENRVLKRLFGTKK